MDSTKHMQNEKKKKNNFFAREEIGETRNEIGAEKNKYPVFTKYLMGILVQWWKQKKRQGFTSWIGISYQKTA